MFSPEVSPERAKSRSPVGSGWLRNGRIWCRVNQFDQCPSRLKECRETDSGPGAKRTAGLRTKSHAACPRLREARIDLGPGHRDLPDRAARAGPLPGCWSAPAAWPASTPPVCSAASSPDSCGRVSLRHMSRLRHIAVGRAYARQEVILPIAGAEVRVLDAEGSLIRELTLDASRVHQPLTNLKLSTMSCDRCPRCPETGHWSRRGDSNPRPTVYETVALPAELRRPQGS